MERHYILETGFRSVVQHAGCPNGEIATTCPNIAILCEYDALPDIGHACGHNLIAEVGVGASIGIKAALDHASVNGHGLGKVILPHGYWWCLILLLSSFYCPQVRFVPLSSLWAIISEAVCDVTKVCMKHTYINKS